MNLIGDVVNTPSAAHSKNIFRVHPGGLAKGRRNGRQICAS